MEPGVGVRLSLMMFLQYAIWGAWLPILYPYLTGHVGLELDQVGSIFAVGAVGAILAPFVAGQIADRWFATERFLGLSHLAGAALVWQLASIETYSGFLWFSLAYSLVYSPTLSLTNSLAFHHIPDRDRDFGRVRVWGTVGWIAVSIAVGQWLKARHMLDLDLGRADAFRLSAMLGAAMGVFCFTLPHTPPARGEEAAALTVALKKLFSKPLLARDFSGQLVRSNPLLALFLIAVPVSCIHQFYFVHTSQFLTLIEGQAKAVMEFVTKIFGVGGGGLMAVGQMSELLVLALVPVLAKTVARRTFLLVGLAAYAARMLLFMNADAVGVGGVVFGVALHGVCFGCFIFVAFMIVDEQTSGDVKASAQSLFNLVIVGIGIIVGSMIATKVANWSLLADGSMDYGKLFSVPMWASVACMVVLLLTYPGKDADEHNSEPV